MKKKQRLGEKLRGKLNIVLAFVLAFSLFFGNSATVNAMTNTGLFYYDISPVWNPSLGGSAGPYENSEDYPYVYIFYLKDSTVGIELLSGCGYKYCLIMTSSPLVSDNILYTDTYCEDPYYILARDYNVSSFKMRAYISSTGVTWSSVSVKAIETLQAAIANPGLRATYCIRYSQDRYLLMTNTHIRHYLSRERLFTRNISLVSDETGSNIPTPDDDDIIDNGDGTITGGSTGSTGSSGSSGGSSSSGSSGSLDDESRSLWEVIRDNIIAMFNSVTAIGKTLTEDISGAVVNTYNTFAEVSDLLHNEYLSTFEENTEGVVGLISWFRGDFWLAVEDFTKSQSEINQTIRDSITEDTQAIVEGLADVKSIFTLEYIESMISNATNITDLTTLFRDHIWGDIQTMTQHALEMLELVRDDMLSAIKDMAYGISTLVKNFRADTWQAIHDTYDTLSTVADLLRTNFLENIVLLAESVVKLDDFLRVGLFGGFSSLFNDLFVPRENIVEEKFETIKANVPIINSAYTSIVRLQEEMSALGAQSPIITIPFSNTSFSKYGLDDVVIDFEWFAPYRQTVLNIESAFMWAIFIFRQYFGIKDLFNASGGEMGAISSALNVG